MSKKLVANLHGQIYLSMKKLSNEAGYPSTRAKRLAIYNCHRKLVVELRLKTKINRGNSVSFMNRDLNKAILSSIKREEKIQQEPH